MLCFLSSRYFSELKQEKVLPSKGKMWDYRGIHHLKKYILEKQVVSGTTIFEGRVVSEKY